ncbi:MAG: hypothetical protein Q9165_002965 [Trypethelium subeluteriae]
MLDCPSCLERCFQAVVSRSHLFPASRRQFSPYTRQWANQRRSRPYATAVEISRKPGFLAASEDARLTAKERRYPTKAENAKILAYKHKHRVHQYKHDANGTQRQVDEEQLRLELAYLKDPLKLSDRVWSLLHQDDEEKAVTLARMASSKNMQCVVGWNHIIDWMMSKGKANAAVKTYNEMKKRAQFPDSYTYLLLLRGFAKNCELPNSLGNALSIYYSMSGTGTRVRPTIIHSNAMLKVCVRTKNMDALWGVIEKLPEEGSGAPDNLTFTTILNALGMQKFEDRLSGMTEEEYAARRDDAVSQGRQIWGSIVNHWRKGRLLIDADLVCAMGRLLLGGVRARDWDDVLSLIQQTMDITRLIAPFGSKEREHSHVAPRLRAPHVAAGLTTDVRLPNTQGKDNDPELRPRSEFDSIRSSENTDIVARSSSPTFAQPDNNTLSAVIEACQKMYAKKLADQYWELFTKKFDIVPDLDNLHMYLRCLRQYRSSVQTVELLRTHLDGADAVVAPAGKTFRIAMSCCARDSKNPHIMTHAKYLLDLMEKKLSQSDSKTVSLYLDLALSTRDSEHILYAVERAQKAVTEVKSLLSFGAKINPRAMEEALEFLGNTLRVYFAMLRDDRLTHTARSQFQERRARLQAFLDRHKSPRVVPVKKTQSAEEAEAAT